MNDDDDPGERVVALKESIPPHSVVVVEQNRYEPGHCTEYAFIYTQWAGYFLNFKYKIQLDCESETELSYFQFHRRTLE